MRWGVFVASSHRRDDLTALPYNEQPSGGLACQTGIAEVGFGLSALTDPLYG
jgi:hypothetical protein